MIPDLGKYATEVLGAYAVTSVLLIVLVAGSVLRARAVRRQLKDYEDRQRNG